MDICKLEASFEGKMKAEGFCKKLREMAYKYDVVTVNDILQERGLPVSVEGFHYGYNKKEIKKLKPAQFGKEWFVTFPKPGKLVRDANGYWTTENGADM